MQEFKRVQHEITDGVPRQHYIPRAVYKFAKQAQDEFPSPGKSRTNAPTLADIYYQLTLEGINLIKTNFIEDLEFAEIGRPEGGRFVQIVFDQETNTFLEWLKSEAENGVYKITPYKEISMISLAVNLMEYAIKAREKAVTSNS